MKAYVHLFFDLDRTLWDFERNSNETMQELAEEHRLSERGIPSLDEFLVYYYRINDQLWVDYREGRVDQATLRIERFRRAFEQFGVDDPDLIHRFGNDYVRMSPLKNNLVENTLEVLDYLKQKNYRLHIITNGFNEVQHVKIKNAGLSPYFEEIITSERAGNLKPHPEIFAFAELLTNAEKSACLMIGDSLEADVVGARNAGWGQVYFNPDRIPHQEELDHEIQGLIQLKDIL